MGLRDLKAENVLKNSDGRWVICDFGSATTRAQVYESPAEIAVSGLTNMQIGVSLPVEGRKYSMLL